MRGTFFQKPFEYSLEIQGEKWMQGETIKGTCTIKNHSAETIDLSTYSLGVAFADHKKIKAKDPKAFAVINHMKFDLAEVAATSEASIDFSLALGKDNPISENTKGVYFVCGPEENYFDGGLLELPVEPINIITEFLEVFKRFFRFEVKALKNKKGYIEAKMLAPASKGMGGVEQLMLLLKMDNETLELKYNFKVKKLAYDEGNVKAQAQKLEITSQLSKKQYALFGDSTNQEGIQAAIAEVLEQVKRKTTY